ncbi:S41 family peptidase [Glycomyces harbinensis]|uniref:N-terminal domain of Peptidase_S41 n=1 Tax=Glycomyces harbinensis TaxID=58114 RepID=A0A1G6U8V3_9ACTN|nr:S41 family peptidase [Glycomyces harbinensis]SDD37743.1 N-terminal domain of Peptidase_S41 [Glycomyces harbinensis]
MPPSAATVVPDVVRLLREHYVFPDVADELGKTLTAHAADGRYTDADQARLAELVTADLQSVNGDLHLRLKHSAAELSDTHDDEATQLRQMAEWSDLTCGGVAHAQRLPGNVGLLKIAPLLFPPAVAGEKVTAAMNLLAATDALILDLRECLGGDPNTVALAYSYLTDFEPVQLSGMAKRDPADFEQLWTFHVPGAKFGGAKPVWVLISATTFSGGEALSFDLQERGRAVVIGERTRGGAHPRQGFRVDTHLEVTIPTARSVSPISGGNWEGVGVTPDVPTTADDALPEAHRRALEAVLALGAEGLRAPVADEAAQALRALAE